MSPKSRKTSVLWTYYKAIRDTHYAKCSFCSARISYKTSSTNLKRHLQRKHPAVYLKIFQLIEEEILTESIEMIEADDPLSADELDSPKPLKPIVVNAQARRSSLLGKRSSKLWNYFDVVNNERQVARCTLCDLKLSFRSTNTNLRKHLDRRHHEEYITLDSTEAIRAKPKVKKPSAKAAVFDEHSFDLELTDLPMESPAVSPRRCATSVEKRKVYQTRFALSWDSYQNRLCSNLSTLLKNEDFVDLTLAAGGHLVKVHQLIMGIASPYLKEIIRSSPARHPIIFLTNVSYTTLKNLLQYVYTGQVDIAEDELEPFFAAAKALQIQGIDTDIDTDILKLQADDQANDDDTAKLTPDQNKPVEEEEPDGDDFDESQFLIMPRSATTRAAVKQDTEKTPTKPNRTRRTSQNPPEEMESGDLGDVMMDEDMVIVASEDLSGDGNSTDFFEVSRKDDPDPVMTPTKNVDNVTVQTMILNHYKYSLISTSADGGVRKWQCIDHLKHGCQARTITNANTVVKRSRSHNHPFNDKL